MDFLPLVRLTILYLTIHIVAGLIPGVIFYKRFWSVQGKARFDRLVDNFIFYLGFAWQLSIFMTVIVWIYFHLQFLRGLISYVDVIVTTSLFIFYTIVFIIVGHLLKVDQKEFEEG